MSALERNQRRYRAILIAREVKWVMITVPERLVLAVARRWLIGWLMRMLFCGPDDKPHRAGEIVLAEIRRITLLDRVSSFHTDPAIMAYREGKRAVGRQIFEYLGLDETTVRKLMEVDDGN